MTNKILILGDSHSQYFRGDLTLSIEYGYKDFLDKIICHIFQSASIRGFGKRQSTLNLSKSIVEKVKGNDCLVLCFGQVDIELGFFYKRIIKSENISIEDFVSECILSYEILLELVAPLVNKIIVKGINFPVIINRHKAIRYTNRIITENISDKDEANKSLARLMKFLPNIHERISFSAYFNQCLKVFAIKNGITYFDINKDIAYKNGLVKEEFIPTSFDHHIVDSIKARMIHLDNLKIAIEAAF